MIDLQIDTGELDKLLGMFQISKEAARRAARRAVRKAAVWTRGQAAVQMSKELRITQKAIRSRLRLYTRGDGLEQKVFVGLNALAARRLGVPRRVPGGTRVGAHYFPGAFPIRRFGNGVYRRTGPDRFPLELARLPIDAVGADALRDAAGRAEERLLTLLRQEFNFEFQRAGFGRAT